MRPFTVPPFQPRVHVARYVVQEGDSLEGICASFGLSGLAYGELVGANLERGLTTRSVREGYPLKLAHFAVGDHLKLPIHWPVASISLGGGAPNPGEDNALSPEGLIIAKVVQAHAGDDPDKEKAVWNAVSQWWRQEHPTASASPDEAAMTDQLAPYVASALLWWQAYGAHLPTAAAQQLPWSYYPFATAKPALLVLQGRDIDWGAVRDWGNQHIKPGMVNTKRGWSDPGSNTGTASWSAQQWKSTFWETMPWGLAWGQIPAALIPWGYTTFPRVAKLPAGTGRPQTTGAFLLDLAEAVGLPLSEARPAAPQRAPKKRPPPTIEVDATPGGSGDKPPPTTTTAPPAVAPAPGRWVWYAVGGVVTLGLVVGGVVVFTSGKRGR